MPGITADTVKKLLQELIVPELREFRAELREIRVELKRLDEKIEAKHNESVSMFQRLDEKIDYGLQGLRAEMHSEFKRLDEKIELTLEFRERFAALEAKVAALTSR